MHVTKLTFNREQSIPLGIASQRFACYNSQPHHDANFHDAWLTFRGATIKGAPANATDIITSIPAPLRHAVPPLNFDVKSHE